MTDTSATLETVRRNRVVAEIVSIGDEITTGAILDTNAPYLSDSLSEIGVRALYHSTVGDDMEAMKSAFALAFRRADVVVCTGGLGPTQDDLTRQAVAEVLSVGLEFDQASYDHTEELFRRRGRVMPESNRIQAYFPKGARAIFNPNGTAPGFIVEAPRAILPEYSAPYANYPTGANVGGEFIALFFPGVPAELKEMWRLENGRAAVERFANRIGGGSRPVYRTKRIHSFGAGESAIEARLPNLIARDHFPNVGITAKNGIITLRIFAEGRTEEECEAQISEISRVIYDRVGEFVFGEDDETYPEVFCRNLRAQCRRVGLLEWGTQGAFARLLDSDILGAGTVFGEEDSGLFARLFGDSSATPESERRVPETRETFGASFYVDGLPVSDELRALCDRVANGRKIDYFLAIGPWPTSTPGTADVAFIDCRSENAPVMRRETFAFGGQPAIIDSLFCSRAMTILLKNQ